MQGAVFIGVRYEWLWKGKGEMHELLETPEHVSSVVREGPRGAALGMTDEELIDSLERFVMELPTRDPIMQHGYMITIKALLSELRNRVLPFRGYSSIEEEK